ncbi:MAG: type II toxin-antitoxin system VapC family toxin [Burkholderiales bacterium]|nr:type II toxin-antitoxin system VapC family toxin [Phycisphaerae bacterium]
MAGEYLLDTNILSGWYRGEIDVPARLTSGKSAFISSIVMGELVYGLEGLSGNRKAILKAFLDDAFATLGFLSVNAETATLYGTIKNQLKVAGKPIPENDIWIAASARLHGFILVSRDAHFASVEGLEYESW